VSWGGITPSRRTFLLRIDEWEVNVSKDHTFWSVLALVLVFGLGGCFPVGLLSTPTPSPTPVGLRRIAENTLGLREYWRVSHTCLGGSRPGLAAASGRVACLYYDPESTSLSVRVFDAARGDLLWEAPGIPNTGLASVFADVERMYFKSMFEIQAYDLDDGRQLWKRSVPIKGTCLHPDGEKLYALEGGGGSPWMLYTLDTHTGDTLSSESVSTDDDFILFARFPQLDLYYGLAPHSSLRAVDSVTRQTRWSIEDRGIFRLPDWPPVLLDDILLIDTGWEVIAFEAQSGQVKWRSPDLSRCPDTAHATEAVMVDGSLYALRRDARLVRWDARSGEETGYIQFAPPLPDISGGIGDFFSLAADGQMIFVSFDDSDESIALGP